MVREEKEELQSNGFFTVTKTYSTFMLKATILSA
jgi:hypothetical protein